MTEVLSVLKVPPTYDPLRLVLLNMVISALLYYAMVAEPRALAHSTNQG